MNELAEKNAILVTENEALKEQLAALTGGFAEVIMHKDKLADELNALAKIAPVACKKRLVNHRSGVEHHWTYHGEVDRASSGDIFRVEVVPLFERPAPAVSLAELVPKRKPISMDAPISADWAARTAGYRNGFNDCVDEVLRNIEEVK